MSNTAQTLSPRLLLNGLFAWLLVGFVATQLAAPETFAQSGTGGSPYSPPGPIGYSTTSQSIEGIIPFTKPVQFSITSPSNVPYPVTMAFGNIQLTAAPKNVPSATALSYLTIVAAPGSSFTFTAAGQKQMFTVTLNVPSTAATGAYGYQIYTTGWPGTSDPASSSSPTVFPADSGLSINATVSPPANAGAPPVVAISSPANGATYGAGVSIPLTFTSTSTSGAAHPILATAANLSGVPILLLTNSPALPTASATTTGSLGVLPAGTYTVQAAATNDGGTTYSAQNTFTVAASKTNTITFAPLSPVTYGAGPVTLTATATSGLPVTYTSSNPAVATVIGGTVTITGAGSTTITASQLASAALTALGLNVPAAVQQTLVVNPATLTVTAANATKVYGAANPTFTTLAMAGFVNGDSSSVVTGSAALNCGATATSAVGTYPIVAALGTLKAANYTFTFVNGNLTVTKAPLTVTANNATRAFGAANPAFTATISGFVNGDTVGTAVTGTPAFTTTATSTSVAGSYPITPSLGTLVATNTNYAFLTFIPGTLTVTGGTPHSICGTIFFDTNCDGNFDSNKNCQNAYTSYVGCNSSGWSGYACNQNWSGWWGSQWGYAGSYSNQLCGNGNNNNYSWGWGWNWGNNNSSSGNNWGDTETSHTCDYGLASVTVNLLNAANQVVATTTTNAQGAYCFTNIMPGSYYVVAVAPSGLQATTPNDIAETVASADVTVAPIGFGISFTGLKNCTASCKPQSYWCSKTQSYWPSQSISDCTNTVGNLCTGVFGGISTQSACSLLSTRSNNACDQLAASLLAAEYNCASGNYINGDANLTYHFLWWGECVLSNPSQYSTSYVTWAKQWFDAYNNCNGGVIKGPSS